jgi:hypothetical protein
MNFTDPFDRSMMYLCIPLTDRGSLPGFRILYDLFLTCSMVCTQSSRL